MIDAMLTLKQFRKKYKLTQKELALKLGTTSSTISKYENGEWVINQSVYDRIKAEYGEDIRPLKNRPAKKVWMKRGSVDQRKRNAVGDK